MPESFANKPSQALHAAERQALALCDGDAKRAAALLEGVAPSSSARGGVGDGDPAGERAGRRRARRAHGPHHP